MKTPKNIYLFLTIFLIITGFYNTTAKAYGDGLWSSDARVPGYMDDTATPFLLADQNKTVHAFASQWVENVARRRAIVYRQWSLMGGWTRPVDVILAPEGDANFLSAYLDSSGVIHVIYASGAVGDGDVAVYYSYAPAASADIARAWSLPIMVGEGASSVYSAAIMGDDNGSLVILYSGIGSGNGVYMVSSHNSGHTWSDPKPIFLTYDSHLVPYSIKTFIGKSKRLHAVWAVATSLGLYDSIYYIGHTMETGEWDTPVLLEKRTDAEAFFGPSYPTVVDNGENVVVMYNSGNPISGGPVDYGRPIIRVRFSGDGGQSWSEAVSPFPLLQGNSGEHSMVVDSNNVVHALFIMRIDSSVDGKYSAIGGVWYSELVDSIWSKPARFVTSIPPVNIRAVVSQGNAILATWEEDPGAGQDGVWFSHSSIDAPELPVVPLPTLPTGTKINPEITVVPDIKSPTEINTELTFDQLDKPLNPAQPLLSGIIPVVLLIFGVIITYGFFYKRK